MTPIEKAKELFNKFYDLPVIPSTAKDCAIIAVEELMEQCKEYVGLDFGAAYKYWENVKKEIIAL